MFKDTDTCDVFHLDPAKVTALKRTLLAETTVSALAETFKVLGDPTRVRILDAIMRSELCVCDIARLVGLSESAVSHQLRILRGMRLVRQRRAGRMVFYALDDQHIVHLFEQGLGHVQERSPAASVPPGPAWSRRSPASGSHPVRVRQAANAGTGRART
jgi:ArsR family transcriptional regulator, lead/cadmium/zinc/bismuth-responsive transcriptional repressor